jgi:hypothetical protein
MRGIVEEIPREKISTIRLTGTSPKQQNAAAPATSTNAALEAPEEQVHFCLLLGSFQREQMAYMQETNPIRKAGMRVPDPYRYEAQVRDLFGPKHEFVNWTGSLRFGTSGRSIGIVFTPACEPQQVIQFGNALEQSGFAAQDGTGTIIHTDSPIGRTFAGANSAEQPAIASGTLVPVPGFLRCGPFVQGNRKAPRLRRSGPRRKSIISAAISHPLTSSSETSIYWMRERFHLFRRVCIKILEHSLSLRGLGGGDHLRSKN